jgi:Domain of unknown function (DU1801)
MATSAATTPDEYIAALPDDRREAVATVREVINRNLPPGYVEGMSYGMIAWWVPLETFPDTYNGEPLGLAGIASQKNYMSLYLMTVYGSVEEEAWFKERYAQSGKKLNMGKSCLRFRHLEDVPLDVIGETVARADLDRMLAHYTEARGSARKARAGGG